MHSMHALICSDTLQEERRAGRPAVRASTVDNFQGEEARVVIVSLVRSNPSGAIGFLKEPQRVNVLLSRARDALILLGNPLCLLGHRGQVASAYKPHVATHSAASSAPDLLPWRAINGGQAGSRYGGTHVIKYEGVGAHACGGRPGGLHLASKAHWVWETVFKRLAPVNAARPGITGFPRRCERHGEVALLACAQDFAVQAPSGGCSRPCAHALACGHVCASACHPPTMPHPACVVEVPCRYDPIPVATL